MTARIVDPADLPTAQQLKRVHRELDALLRKRTGRLARGEMQLRDGGLARWRKWLDRNGPSGVTS